MRIAFLVAAHTDAKQVENLINRLAPNKHFDSVVYLHIDAKTNITLFNDAINKYYVRLTKNRINVIRCGFSQVEAGLELIKTSLESGEKFDRYVMITGQDYPVVSNEELRNRLSSNCEFMRAHKVTGTAMNKKVVRYYFYNKFLTGNSLKDSARRAVQLIYRLRSKKDTFDFKGEKWNIYYSSAYFAVSYELLCELYEKGCNKKYINYFKTAICSDEMFFITIAANGSFRNKLEIVDNPSHTLLDNSSITYFNYLDRPILLTEENYDEIKKSDRIFARKFSSKESYELLRLLDYKNK